MLENHLERTTHSLAVTTVAYSDVFPKFRRYVEGPEFVGYRRILNDSAVHVDLVAEQYARMSVSWNWKIAYHVRSFPDVTIVIVYIYHLRSTKALSSYHIEGISPDDGAVAGGAFW